MGLNSRLELEIELPNGAEVRNVSKDLEINSSAINQELEKHPANEAFYRAIADHRVTLVDKCKKELKRLEAEVENDVRRGYMGKPPAQRVVELDVILDSRVDAKRDELLELEERLREAENAAWRMVTKRISLVNLSKNFQSDYGGVDPTVRSMEGSEARVGVQESIMQSGGDGMTSLEELDRLKENDLGSRFRGSKFKKIGGK